MGYLIENLWNLGLLFDGMQEVGPFQASRAIAATSRLTTSSQAICGISVVAALCITTSQSCPSDMSSHPSLEVLRLVSAVLVSIGNVTRRLRRVGVLEFYVLRNAFNRWTVRISAVVGLCMLAVNVLINVKRETPSSAPRVLLGSSEASFMSMNATAVGMTG